MASFTKLGVVFSASLACALATAPAFAEGAVPPAPEVSTIRNTAVGESEPPPASSSNAASALDASESAVLAPPLQIQKVYPFRVKAPDMKRRIEIRSANDEVIARCVGSCNLLLPEGEYVARNYETESATQELEFTVQGPGGIELKDSNPTTANVGLALGIAGPVTIVAGYVLFIEGLSDSCLMSECQSSGGGTLAAAGLGAIAAGAAMTPIGWVMWARNRQPKWSELSPPVSVAVVPTREGAIFGLSGRF